MTYPKAFIDFLVYFHADRDYFECHEVLEEYWKEHPDDKFKDAWHICIQLAVTAYHERRGNIAGAQKMLSQAMDRMHAEGIKGLLEELGFDADQLMKLTAGWLRNLESDLAARTSGNRPFQDPDLPIADQSLLRTCRAEAKRRGLSWLAPSPMHVESLIHKHRLRDRSDVIQARQEAWQRKRQS